MQITAVLHFSVLLKLMPQWIVKLLQFLFQRNSISPAEREKYRPRSPPEPEHKKLKKEEKDCHVSNSDFVKQPFSTSNCNDSNRSKGQR